MADIFISYAHKDFEAAEILYEELPKLEYSVFLDDRNVIPGNNLLFGT